MPSKPVPLFLFLLSLPALSQSNRHLAVSLDISDAPRKILHARLQIPVQPGPLILVYPKWIPGEHEPSGPIDNFTGIFFDVDGQAVPWERDSVDMFTFHLAIPHGASTLNIKADFLATAAATGFSAGASTSANLCVVSWNEILLYPAGTNPSTLMVDPSITIPEGWRLGSALTRASSQGLSTRFEPVPLNMLVDSPVLAGRFFKEIPLAPEISPKHFLDLAGDGPEDVKPSSDQLEAFSNLVRETGPLFASRHYSSYHFLLTLSDNVAHFGLEHHESSDDRVEARTFIDDDLNILAGDLLPHEFTHSWNGKYRRPAGLATISYQEPMKGNLLWVYEGMTQYWGDVLAARSGIWTSDQYLESLAAAAAKLDARPGRTWRDLQDTATAAQLLYSASPQYENWRRSVDYYTEGELIWLETDTMIRKLSRNTKSLNDFCARFLGAGGNTLPGIVPYTFEDIVSTLNSIEPFDWTSFFHERLTSKQPHAPLKGIRDGGYRIDYTDQSNEFIHAAEIRDHGVTAWYSLGFDTGQDNTISDVLIDSLAYRAGLSPTMKIVAVNQRAASDEILHQAIRDSKLSSQPMELIIENAAYFQVVKLDYHGGERYPHLIRENSQAALLDDILKPLAAHSSIKRGESFVPALGQTIQTAAKSRDPRGLSVPTNNTPPKPLPPVSSPLP